MAASLLGKGKANSGFPFTQRRNYTPNTEGARFMVLNSRLLKGMFPTPGGQSTGEVKFNPSQVQYSSPNS